MNICIRNMLMHSHRRALLLSGRGLMQAFQLPNIVFGSKMDKHFWHFVFAFISFVPLRRSYGQKIFINHIHNFVVFYFTTNQNFMIFFMILLDSYFWSISCLFHFSQFSAIFDNHKCVEHGKNAETLQCLKKQSQQSQSCT